MTKQIITVARAVIWHPYKEEVCLLQNPPNPLKKAEPNLWTLPGGKTEDRREGSLDCLIETAAREIQEEVGVKVVFTGFLGWVVKEFMDEPGSSITAIFVGVSKDTEFTINPNDDNPPAKVAWIKPADVNIAELTYVTRIIWPHIIKLKRSDFLL